MNPYKVPLMGCLIFIKGKEMLRVLKFTLTLWFNTIKLFQNYKEDL
jgi:hypothetical protein